MNARRGPRDYVVAVAFGCFCAGLAAGWWLHAGPPAPSIMSAADVSGGDHATIEAAPPGAPAAAPAAPDLRRPDAPIATIGATIALEELQHRDLRVPIDGADIERFKGSFAERRGGDSRGHEAMDILAPRHTPVRAVEDGTIAKLFFSKAGGNTIYQYDPSGRFCYYYAHLERYADGLRDGAKVARGDVIGFVGTSGNAPPGTPHLHFAVFELSADRRWWQGKPIDPYEIFHH